MKIYRIINLNNRVIDLKELENDKAAFIWLGEVQAKRKDTFLEVQTQVGRSWESIDSPPRRVRKSTSN